MGGSAEEGEPETILALSMTHCALSIAASKASPPPATLPVTPTHRIGIGVQSFIGLAPLKEALVGLAPLDEALLGLDLLDDAGLEPLKEALLGLALDGALFGLASLDEAGLGLAAFRILTTPWENLASPSLL